ncbi:hypothetical protein LTR28_000220, partial [Elasticomyces elasticus]
RSLSALHAWLRQQRSRLDCLRLWVRHRYRRPAAQPPELRGMLIMGLRPHEVGTASNEYWGAHPRFVRPLLRPDELVMREGVRRGLMLQRFYLDMMLFGYVDGEFRDVPPVDPEEVEGGRFASRAREVGRRLRADDERLGLAAPGSAVLGRVD